MEAVRTNERQIKQTLSDYGLAVDALEELRQQRQELIARSGPRIANNDGMPKSGNTGDPTYHAALRLEKIDSRIEAAAERVRRIGDQIDEWSYCLLIDGGTRGRDMARAVELRYVQRLSPGDTAFEIFGDSADFDDREASFVRRTFRLIDEAAERICKFEKEKNE